MKLSAVCLCACVCIAILIAGCTTVPPTSAGDHRTDDRDAGLYAPAHDIPDNGSGTARNLVPQSDDRSGRDESEADYRVDRKRGL